MLQGEAQGKRAQILTPHSASPVKFLSFLVLRFPYQEDKKSNYTHHTGQIKCNTAYKEFGPVPSTK